MKNRIFWEDDADKQALDRAAQLLHLVFLRVERDSAAGCALRRALGLGSEKNLERAAEDFCVTPSYLRGLHQKLELQLGDLRFLSDREEPNN